MKTHTYAPDAVLVVIPTLNEEKHIEACVNSLLADGSFAAAKVVICDGGSNDATIEISEKLREKFPQIRIVDNPERLQSAAINLCAFEHAEPKHRVLIRCDAHSVYAPGYLASLTAAIAERECASVVVPMDSFGRSSFAKAAAWVLDTPIGNGGSAHRAGTESKYVDHGHHAAFDLDWFRNVGGYDTSFSHNEDAEFDYRLTRAGGKIWMEASTRVDYQVRPNFYALAKQYWSYGRGRAKTFRKHGMRLRLRQMLPTLNVAILALCLGASVFFPTALLLPAAFLLLLLMISIVGTIRMKSIRGLWAGLAVGAIQLPWGAGFVSGLIRR
jgi:succinoglycan biosynthesis protein ExoA